MAATKRRATKAELTAQADERLRIANEEAARQESAEQFAIAYQRHAIAVSELKQREAELKRAQNALAEHWPAADSATDGAGYLATDRGTICRAVKRSFELTAEPAELVEFAMKHGLSITEPRPASVAPATIRAAALRGIDVSSVAAETVSHVYSLN